MQRRIQGWEPSPSTLGIRIKLRSRLCYLVYFISPKTILVFSQWFVINESRC
ncbi:hypothetical protein RHMOL_Rhmol10G0181400 [Rhododendron molle]|uniref:Uncharacterized protein n=1 Tax=Rhododendron molle TaxID=49168 RepID=A0ACC0M4P0_RHOML|nr:hypothetical protein RHMOL_Rhmol10G0181400 [Rhododendron molle]